MQQDHQGYTYTYDNSGNIISRSDGTNYSYDWNNRLKTWAKVVALSRQSADFAYNASGLRVKKHYVENTAPPEGQGELGLLFTDGTNDLGIKSKGVDSVYNKGRDIEKVWVKADGQYYQFAIMYKHLFGETGKMKLFITLDLDTIPNSGRISLPEDTLTRVSRKCAWEYCVYIGDNDYGLYSKNGIKVSMPYGMSVVKTSGPSGIIKVKILKSLLSDAPILRCTVASFNPNQLPNPNPDTLYQGGSRASDVYPGSPGVFGGEIPGYVQVSSGGVAPTGATVEYTVYYLYDGINPILELAPNNSVLAKYVYAGGLHIAKISGADTMWYHCDALGSPRKMTDESGLVSWTGAYQPFGEMLAGTGNVHGFTGKELDAETGLNYFCLRYYDPQIGRFLTLDPFGGYIELPQTQMRYGYCINNPLKYIDPLGLSGGEDGVWTEYKDIWFYIYGSGEMPGVTVIPYNWFSHLSLMQQMEILGYGDTEPIGRLMPEIPFPKGYIGPGQYPWWPETSPGSPPPSGGTAAPDVTYTFPEYKFQPYTPVVIPEWRMPPPVAYTTVLTNPPTIDPWSYSKLYFASVIEITFSTDMVKYLSAAVPISAATGMKYPWLGYGTAAVLGGALGNMVAQEARKRVYDRWGLYYWR
ncbi:MAG: RHS repeat-associated core domain-containing protein [candidate division WOR-3 bacterium]